MRMTGVVLVMLASAGGWAGAQTPAPAGQPAPPPMTNLQIIPKDKPRPQVLQQMQNIAAALGVQCNYCHVIEDAAAASTWRPTRSRRRRRRAA
jgi:hypothetical protein